MILTSFLCCSSIDLIPIQNSSLKSSKEENYSTFEYFVKKDGKTNKIEKGGIFWELVYQFLNEKGKSVKGMSKAEIIENYRKAALEKGGEILYKSPDKLTFSIPRKGGGTSWFLYKQLAILIQCE